MARFDIGDRVINVNMRSREFEEKGTITQIHTGHFRGDGYTLTKDYGGKAEWYDDEVQALPAPSGNSSPAPAKKRGWFGR